MVGASSISTDVRTSASYLSPPVCNGSADFQNLGKTFKSLSGDAVYDVLLIMTHN